MKTLVRSLMWILLGFTFFAVGLFLYGLHLTKKLPWQAPEFDTEKPANPGNLGGKAVLLFHKTNGYEHESITTGIRELTTQGEGRGWNVVNTENGAFFNSDYLKKFKVVVFLNTTGDVLTAEQESAFESYIKQGGGYVGIHAAADTEYEWEFYGELLGTNFLNHSIFPHTPEATLISENKQHPTTSHLPSKWQKVDEWYNFKTNIRNDKNFEVLVSIDETTYDVGETGGMNGDHPISWISSKFTGRMFYTALGHNSETFTEDYSMKHIMTAIEWAGKFNEVPAIDKTHLQ